MFQCSSPDHLPPTESRVANAGLDNISFFQVKHLLLVSKQTSSEQHDWTRRFGSHVFRRTGVDLAM